MTDTNEVPILTPPTGSHWLCEAFGESDRPRIVIADDRAEVRQFIIDEWLGDETDPELDEVMQTFDAHDWNDEPLSWDFEIGGVRISEVFYKNSGKAIVISAERLKELEAENERMKTEMLVIAECIFTNNRSAGTHWANDIRVSFSGDKITLSTREKK